MSGKREKVVSKSLYILVSILFAVILFFNANATELAKKSAPGFTNSQTYTAMVSDVEIDLKYDSDKYFVTGYSNLASVYLSSYNQIRLTTEKNPDTRTFTLLADLSDAQEGTLQVPVRIMNLSNGVTGQVDPANLTVTVEKKASKHFDVVANVPDKQVPKGYSVTSKKVDLTSVKVTSGANIIQTIDHVEARLPGTAILSDNYTGKVDLQAVDKEGKVVSAEIKPETARLEVEVARPSKEVPLVGELVGVKDPQISEYSFALPQDKVTISGDQAAIDKVNQVTALIDVTDLAKEQTLTLQLSAANVTVDPTSVSVKVTPIKKK